MKTDRPLSLMEIFRIPALLALVSLAGLISALLGAGWWDILSWITLGLPVAAIAWAFIANRA